MKNKAINEPDIQNGLNQINWKINTGELKQLDVFQIDIYRFVFQTPIKGDVMADFMKYVKTLSMNKLSSIMKIWVWLYQHNVEFELVFKWNRQAAFMYNINNMSKPKSIHKDFLAYGHDKLMAVPLDKIS